MKKQKQTVTIYRKLLLLFFVALLPFFALSLMANQVAEQRLLQQGKERIAAQLADKVESYETLHWRAYSWMKVNLMDGYKVLLANNRPISSFRLGQLVAELFDDLQKLAQMSDEIDDICVYMPRTGRTISLRGYYDGYIPDDAKLRIKRYEKEYNTFVREKDAFRVHTVLTSRSNSEPLYAIEITLSDQAMLQNLNSLEGEKYAILDRMKVELCEEKDRPLLLSVRDSVIAARQASGQLILQDYLISFQQLLGTHYLVSYIPMKTLLEPVQSFNTFSVIALLLAVVCSILITFSLGRTIHRPFRRLLTLFRRVEDGDMEASLDARQVSRDEFAIIFERFNEMLSEIRRLIDKSVEQEKALQLAEYRSLHAHIAPHFLYNSFNVLRHSIRLGDQDTAEQMAARLGSYFRYLTYMDAQADITLREEYRHVEDYLAIQKLRFQSRITCAIDPLPEKYSGIRIPPFTLQPLVENIFKHGVNDMAGNGEITLRIIEGEGSLTLTVRDNGAGMAQEQLALLRHAMQEGETPQEHTGIVHISRRLRYFFGERFEMQVDSVRNEFFEVRIMLPVEEDV